MTKKLNRRKTSAATPAKRGVKNDYVRLLKAIESANIQMVGRAAAVVNQALVLRNWLVGAYLVEYEQGGADRAKYGAKLLESLAKDLAERGLKGLDARTLRDCRMLFQVYPQFRGPLDPEMIVQSGLPAIRGTLSPEFRPFPIRQTMSDEFSQREKPKRIRPTPSDESAAPELAVEIRQTAPDELTGSIAKRIRGTLSPELIAPTTSGAVPTPLPVETVLQFSWSKLVEFLAIDGPWKRAFYENECLKGNWSVRQLRRQIESLLYERTGLSKNKQAVIEKARAQAPHETIADLIRDPYVLEFAGLAERPEYSEDELETALLDHLQRFLLGLLSRIRG